MINLETVELFILGNRIQVRKFLTKQGIGVVTVK